MSVSGPTAGTADDAEAVVSSECGVTCISAVGCLTTTLGVSWEMTGTGAYTAYSLEVVWGVWMTRGRKYPHVRW